MSVELPEGLDGALFDLDRTLLDVNSGRLWLVAEWRAGRISLRDVAWGGYWLARYSLGHEDGLDQVFDTATRTLEGTSEAELDARVRAWFDEELAHRLRPGAKAALDAHRLAGHRLVVATSSSTYVARRAMECFGLHDEVSTTFHVDGDRFAGTIDRMAIGAAKDDAVAAWAEAGGIDLSRWAFYTDSASDIALMERVGHPVAVHPDRRLAAAARERDWPIVDWGTAPVG
jgi:HAD superfamily hydrolase (TIGR01490 family)